jgi:hypothetical protein
MLNITCKGTLKYGIIGVFYTGKIYGNQDRAF